MTRVLSILAVLIAVTFVPAAALALLVARRDVESGPSLATVVSSTVHGPAIFRSTEELR